jgi:hypothetical protein
MIEKLNMLEKAIDLGVAKGAYNKLEVIELVKALSELYQHLKDTETNKEKKNND